jgi:cytidine deaminase
MTEQEKLTDIVFDFEQYLAQKLIGEAKAAAECAYAPYSEFHVGAALLLADGSISRGCNVENASYGATVCAERVAVWSAVAQGRLDKQRQPQALAVTAQPCALCLQVLSEFVGADFPILVAEGDTFRAFKLGELLPHVFRLD